MFVSYQLLVSLAVLSATPIRLPIGVGLPFAEEVHVELITNLLDALCVQKHLTDVPAELGILEDPAEERPHAGQALNDPDL